MIIIDILSIALALVSGIILGAWLYASRLKRTVVAVTSDNGLNEQLLRQILQRVQELASGTARQVGEHNDYMSRLNEELNGPKVIDADAVAQVIEQLVGANQGMQKKLDIVEARLREQAERVEINLKEAKTDSLTGLPNRRALDEELDHSFHQFFKMERPFCISMLDVDHFKMFNDQHGHRVGDEVLRQVGQLLVKLSMQGETAIRYGGEEFLLVHNGMTVDEGVQRADQIRNSFDRQSFDVDGKALHVTLSTGTAESTHGENMFDLIDRADMALYASKEKGRNRAYWHDGTRCLPYSSPGSFSAGASVVEKYHDATRPKRGDADRVDEYSTAQAREQEKPTVETSESGIAPKNGAGNNGPADEVSLESPKDLEKAVTELEVMIGEAAELSEEQSGQADQAEPAEETASPVGGENRRKPLNNMSPSNRSGSSEKDFRLQTELANRTFFCSVLGRRLSEFRNSGEAPGIIFFHVDYLDQLRRDQGNEAGNVVLQALARFLRAATREQDMVAQFEDAVFSMLLTDARREQLIGVAERLRKAVSQCVLPLGDAQIKFTISIGIVLADERDGAQSLLTRAEEAMQEAVHFGGNRTCFKDQNEVRMIVDDQPTLLG